MAAVTAGIMAATAGVQLFQGIKSTNQAKKALNSFERQALTNVYENMPISTVGSDIMQEASARTTASLVDSSRSGGIRGIMSALPRIQAFDNSRNEATRLYLDNQVQKRDYAIANDNLRIQSMQEQRDNQDLAGLSAQLQQGREDTMSGLRGIGNSLIYGMSDFGGFTPQVDAVNAGVQEGGVTGFGNSFQPQGLTTSMPSKLNFNN
jgi:hypothetical protein